MYTTRTSKISHENIKIRRIKKCVIEETNKEKDEDKGKNIY
jgi:hypothetical protein